MTIDQAPTHSIGMLELADAVVVGGGIMGVAVTEALSRRLSRVLLIEAERCGAGATAGGFAWVNAASKWHDAAYHRLNAEAVRRHVAMAAEWGGDRTGWNGGGSLLWTLTSDRSGFDSLIRRMDALQSWDYPVSRASRGEMQALEPYVRFEPDATGLFSPSEGWVSTPKLIRFLSEQARERHAVVAEYTEATGFTLNYKGAISSVETNRGRVSTRLLVLCAGTETERLANMARGVASERPQPLIRRSPGILVETGTVPAAARIHRVCYPAGGSGLHLRPTNDGGILIGADDTDALSQQHEADSYTGASSAPWDASKTAASLIDRAALILPDLVSGVQVTTRICVRPMPADDLPIAGELPGVTGAYMLISHSGVTLGPLLAQLLADEIVTGRKSPWLSPYRPDRFYPIHP